MDHGDFKPENIIVDADYKIKWYGRPVIECFSNETWLIILMAASLIGPLPDWFPS